MYCSLIQAECPIRVFRGCRSLVANDDSVSRADTQSDIDTGIHRSGMYRIRGHSTRNDLSNSTGIAENGLRDSANETAEVNVSKFSIFATVDEVLRPRDTGAGCPAPHINSPGS